jgi:D-alanyl-D-alanine carboxypeptidase/D-alanyl-D-alanine-endopeptidase (penicillin-binding protein 4)
MKKSKNFSVFYESLPIAGKTGTLSSMFEGTIAEGNLRAKSGSLNRVRCYAGYLTTKAGKEVAFAIMVNNFACSQSEIKNRIEKLLLSLY